MNPTPARSAYWALSALFLFALLVSSTSIDPNDTWWHIRSGQYYLDHGYLPRTDVFSHTAYGQKWFTHEWLSQVLLYEIYDVSGFFGIRVLNSLMAGLSILLLYRFFRAGTERWLPILFGIIAIYPDLLGRMNTRPEIFTIPFAIAALHLILNRDRSRLPSWKMVITVGLLSVLWANLHGMALLGIMYLFVYIIGEVITFILQRRFKLPDWQAVTLRAVQGDLILLVVSGLAVLCSPMGFDIYVHAYKGSQFLPGPLGIMEWLSPFQFLGGILHSFLTRDFPWINVPLAWQFLFLAIPLAYFFVLPIFSRRGRLPTAAEFFVVLLAVYQGAGVVRFRWLFFIPLFWIVKGLAWSQPSADVPRAERRFSAAGIVLTPLMLLIIGSGLFILLTRGINFNRALDAENYPIGIANFLADADVGGRLFNTYNWGGYLIFRLTPRYRVFIDGRTDLYALASRNLMLDHVTIDNKEEGYQELLDQYQVDILIANSRIYFPGPEYEAQYQYSLRERRMATGTTEHAIASPENLTAVDTAHYRPAWIPLLVNREGSVYLRNTPDRQATLDKFRRFYETHGVTFDDRCGPNFADLLVNHPALAMRYNLVSETLVRDIVAGLDDSTSDKTIAARVDLASALIGQEFFRDAIAILQDVLVIDRYNSDALLNIARAHHLLGENDQAMAYLGRAVNVVHSEAASQFVEHCRRFSPPRSNRLPALPALSVLARNWQRVIKYS